MQHAIRQQLKLTEQQLKDAISCTIDGAGYIEILRRKGILGTTRNSSNKTQ
jgi:hypothetical protein